MGKPIRILLVEDTQRDEALLQLYLKKGGYEPTIRRVQTAFTMKQQLDGENWDVIICDFSLPGFDAHAALKLLKESGREIPFVVVTSETSKTIRDRLSEEGVTEYIAKYEMGQIVPTLERLMAG